MNQQEGGDCYLNPGCLRGHGGEHAGLWGWHGDDWKSHLIVHKLKMSTNINTNVKKRPPGWGGLVAR